MQRKMKKKMALLLSLVLFISAFNRVLPITAAETENGFNYVMYSTSLEENSINLNCSNICMNGNLMTNGTVGFTGNFNHNGQKVLSEGAEYYFIYSVVNENYFKSNYDTYNENRIIEDINVNMNKSELVYGSMCMSGNVNLNACVQSMDDLVIKGGVLNANNTVIMSKYGDITIDSSNVSITGLIYAPFGTVTINASNCNLNNVVVIAHKIQIKCDNLNANYNSNIGKVIGNESEGFYCDKSEWQYLEDVNDNDIPDIIEFVDFWHLLKDTDNDGVPDVLEEIYCTDINGKDTDGDGLDDYYELYITLTEPTNCDTDGNGVSDSDEDFDLDGLTNIREYDAETYPLYADTDGDGLKDGDEINIYGTSPLDKDVDEDFLNDDDEIYFGCDPYDPDTNDNGVLDGNEKRLQEFEYINENSVISNVKVSMDVTGNIQKTTRIENIMDKDIMCSEVVGLVGEPFSIETDSEFDVATISFEIDKSMLGENEFTDLLFLWYDEENYEFVELDTIYDEDNSIVSVKTTHFSKYMIVNKNTWYEAWSYILDYEPIVSSTVIKNNTVLAIDCSGSMDTYDPISYVSNKKQCERIKSAEGFILNMTENDKTAVVLFESSAKVVSNMTNDVELLKNALQGVTSYGGTSYDVALSKSLSLFSSDVINVKGNNNIIVLLSDGISSVSESYLNEAVKKGIKIYTIGLGKNSSDDVLEHIADVTNGKFFKAYTSADLADIYEKVEYETDYSRDTDGDGLLDVLEMGGIRIQNGTIITGCDIYSTDTDGDGLLDFQEIIISSKDKNIEIKDSIGTKLINSYYNVMISNPTKSDTDGDGLLDGRSQEYKGNLIAPKDPDVMKKTGPDGLWKQHISEIKNNINTSYDYSGDFIYDYYDFAPAINEYNYGLIYVWVPDLGKTMKSVAASIGSYSLGFAYDDEYIALHSDKIQWQWLGGYNDAYDSIFDFATDMDYLKLNYTCDDKDYVVWVWKGDYLNLGAGAEIGLYEQNWGQDLLEWLTGFDHWTPSPAQDMSLSLYQIESEDGYSSYFHWLPGMEQWWITGFDPDTYMNDIDIKADELVMISTIDFSEHPERLDALKSKYQNMEQGKSLIFDGDNECLWIIW